MRLWFADLDESAVNRGGSDEIGSPKSPREVGMCHDA